MKAEIYYRQKRWYCNYARVDFVFFRPQGRHVSPSVAKFGTAEGTKGSICYAKFHVDRAHMGILDPQTPEIPNCAHLFAP